MLAPTLCLIILVGVQAMMPDEVSSFFLKAPKSVPRAGRSAPGSYDGFFLKASKSVPRVGRRDGNGQPASYNDYQNWMNDKYQAAFQENNGKWDGPDDSTADTYFYDLYPKKDLSGETYVDGLSHRSRRYNLNTLEMSPNSGKEIDEINFQSQR